MQTPKPQPIAEFAEYIYSAKNRRKMGRQPIAAELKINFRCQNFFSRRIFFSIEEGH